MSEQLIKRARLALSGKMGRLEDEEQEELAKEITKLGFKLGPARCYAYGPTLVKHLADALETAEKQLKDIRAIAGKA